MSKTFHVQRWPKDEFEQMLDEYHDKHNQGGYLTAGESDRRQRSAFLRGLIFGVTMAIPLCLVAAEFSFH